jgi:hypothetical protein
MWMFQGKIGYVDVPRKNRGKLENVSLLIIKMV